MMLAKEPCACTVPIKRARRSDLPALVRLEQQCFSEGVAIKPRQFRYLVGRPTVDVWVCHSQGELAGDVILLRRSTPRGLLGRFYSLAVARNHRQQGLGRKLMKHGLNELRRAGAYAAMLEVREDNERAMRLYLALGFQKVIFLKNYYAAGEHAWRMWFPFAANRRVRRPGLSRRVAVRR